MVSKAINDRQWPSVGDAAGALRRHRCAGICNSRHHCGWAVYRVRLILMNCNNGEMCLLLETAAAGTRRITPAKKLGGRAVAVVLSPGSPSHAAGIASRC